MKKNSGGLTSPFEPEPELQSEAGVLNYVSRLAELSRPEFCVEFSNVRAAKHNLMALPVGLGDHQKTQAIVTDLTDKSTLICMFAFGKPAVLRYAGSDLRAFNMLINEVDDEVAQMNLETEQHGELLLRKLWEHLQG